ncbi:MAG: polysaccharide pyruvyl transferase family protein [Acutalibacteraceae bacterium]|nr:polysaccharide pyruvyl transferase family protein [Acutalibacteraceae bacterium]
MRYAFYSHGGSQNHGCEAIVRTLSSMIKKEKPDSFLKLYTFKKAEDEKAGFPFVDEMEEFDYSVKPKNVNFSDKIKIALYSKQSQKKADDFYYTIACRNPSLKKNDVYISVGGDNYCYGDGHVAKAMNTTLRSMGKKTVLWGCSIGPEDMTPDKIEDLKGFDLIVARETYSYNALIENGIDKNTVLYPDSAFLLPVDEKMNESFEVKEHTVGLNISNFVYPKDCDENHPAKKAVFSLIRYILDETDLNILLIPHVTRDNKADCETLGEIYQKFKCDRVGLVGGEYSATEYKSIISRCEAFIGARTHATIAAYSTCVPTLVIGYSIKSKGIAKDIFGTYEGYVFPVEELSDSNRFIEIFKNFYAQNGEMRKYLQSFMPDYISKAENSIKELFKL